MTIQGRASRRDGGRTTAPTLFWAELGRAARTRATRVFFASAGLVTLGVFAARAVLGGISGEPPSGDLIVLSADVVGFVVLLGTALAVTRDHQSGAIDLVRVLSPSRGRQLLTHAAAHAVLAVGVVLVVVTIGLVATLAIEPSTGVAGGFFDGVVRLLLTTALLAFAGSGIGALCRSSALTTFVVLTLFLLLPIALLVAGFAGQAWAGTAADGTLGLLASTAISSRGDAWAAVAGVGVWAVAAIALGAVRTRGDAPAP